VCDEPKKYTTKPTRLEFTLQYKKGYYKDIGLQRPGFQFMDF